MKKFPSKSTILGLDIGPNSIGWAMLYDGKDGKPAAIIESGVRVFKAGLDDLKMDGRGKLRNIARREARGRRRLIERRKRRLSNLAQALQRFGLLPADYNFDDAQQRHLSFEEIDKKLGSPYNLRSRALDEKLEMVELGRAIYSLAKRRGFLSNRKSQVKDEKEERGIKKEISDLEEAIVKSGARTLGEYFSRIDTSTQRIRAKYTSRKMHLTEFECIWNKQKEYYPETLNDNYQKKIRKLIFYQRPLRNQRELVGQCELEPVCKRAPWALIQAQRFRYLQILNNLRVYESSRYKERMLSEDEYSLLAEVLETKGDMTFPKIRELLKLPKNAKFNLELGGEKKIPGNRTTSKLIKIFGNERWQSLSGPERETVVEDLRSIVKEETLKRRGVKKWRLDKDKAEELSKLKLEEGHCRFSRQVIDRLIPLLEKGVSLQTAIKELYPQRFEHVGKPLDILPPVESKHMPELRNPIVERSLTELRRLVNSITKRLGKPDITRVELARELRQTSKQREKTTKQNRINESARQKAAERILKETGIENPSRTDILKVLLAEECNWECPYTGKQIKLSSLIGDFTQFDIEHIIPFDRCLDNSYMNKTLCYAEENRKVKHKRTPYEAYHGTDKWNDITESVKRFKGNARYAKLQRFQMKPEDVQKLIDNFTERQLNDTRWASKWAKKYLGLLYGGVNDDGIDGQGKRKVQAVTGQVTAHIRGVWGLNRILGDDFKKSRDDHRHHAIDAIVVALADAGKVKMLSDASRRAGEAGYRLYDDVPQPWDGFYEEVKNIIGKIVVSHRVSRRVRGPMHQESFYSKPRKDKGGQEYVAIRKPIAALSKIEIENIIHPTVKKLVKEKLEELNTNPAKAFTSAENHPCIKTRDGKEIPIHSVRVRMNLSEVFPVGSGNRVRYVMSDINHHMEIVEVKTAKRVKWDCYIVSMFEAYQRLKNNEPIIKREFGENKKFLFSLAGNEIIELDSLKGNRRDLFVVRTIPKSKQLYFVAINDARKLKDIGKKGLTAKPDSLRERHCRKVVVTPLGEVRYAND